MSGLFEKLLEEKGVLLADGATGSNLFHMGLQTGDSPELWNDLHPDRIARQYQSFIDAGSDIILTNTFGGTRYRLKLHDAADRVEELNIKAVQIARQQVEKSGRRIVIGGSMGPTGEILQPVGSLDMQSAIDAFTEQAMALKKGGVDVLWVETMSSKEEATAAVVGASRAELPVVATFSVDTNGRTMMGLTPDDIVRLSGELTPRPIAVGANCGVGASELLAAMVNMQCASERQGIEIIAIAKANCGVPEYINGEIVYSGTTEIMAEYVRMAMDAGVRIIGGCCGTTPDHIRAMREAMDNHNRQAPPSLEQIQQKLGDVSSGARAQMGGDLSIAGGSASGRSERRSRRRKR